MSEPPDKRRGQAQPRPASSTDADHHADTAKDAATPATRQPSTFGLTPRELYLEAVTLFANGVPLEEIRQMIMLPDEVLR
ncbi:hypothetical protein SAMN05443575_1344 [Jatrophihabitans endophyticus]|uniref:Uncharacterized protein n=1 Tax=Jatrophihabitans endophyticus TaxID=1206085 RepID=A0A1M5GZI0_9ACTN|nr:hypothetical protein [Jatrophihabitans endophyticus]SHG09144.1 hypothetical protein SAMN05443575_1344 [Jatrophihabitans endophyticus]